MIKMDSENDKSEKAENTASDAKEKSDAAAEEASGENFPSELVAPIWSVVSFETRVASNLTYTEAVQKLNQLATEKTAGLCIITDEAAERIKN